MSRGDKPWIVAGAVVALAGLGWLGLRHRPGERRHDPAEAQGDGFQGFSSRPFSPSSAASVPAPGPETPQMIEQQVGGLMERWRTAVLVKDARAAVALDLTFRQAPERFAPALARTAETDADERVRAFSTRVLGKLKDPARAPLYERLLRDRSPYVRQNAAWALGELGAAATPAVAELQKASVRDPATDVRAAARDALAKL
jgi:hypothetical protein